MTYEQQIDLELVKFGLALLVTLITLGLGWLIGQRLTMRWNLLQKRREIDLASVQQFHAIYGEFKEVSKIWRLVKRPCQSATVVVPSDIRWKLLTRACVLESKFETIVAKISTERDLSKEEGTTTLGLFRQALQKVRESIRDDDEIPFNNRGHDYAFFNVLAVKTSAIVSSSRPVSEPNLLLAIENLFAIASIRRHDFKEAIEKFRQDNPDLADFRPSALDDSE